MPKKNIEEILLNHSLITPEQLNKAREESRRSGIGLGTILIRSGLLNEEDYARVLSEYLDVPYINLGNYIVDPEIVRLIPENVAEHYKAIPIFKIGNTITVAMADPKDIMAIDDLAHRLGCDIESVLATETGILKAIDQYYRVKDSVQDVIKEIKEENIVEIGEDEAGFKKLVEIAGQAPIIKLVNMIIMQAIKERSSDIHIEPTRDSLNIRFRIDGLLYEAFHLTIDLASVLISRIKVLSGMDIAEKRKPQDGRFNLRIENRDIDFRVASFPTIYGENIVIRILDRDSLLLGLERIGFSSETQHNFETLIKRPYGIILVTGPTGSGKTTTLYSALSKIDSEERNIITIEDPVEYNIGRIRQSQVNPKAGLTFATGLRSILRQDPDVIMVGEIRDRETAEISIQAALTGHLVFSTLHTNDSAGALTRLIDMGIEPFLVSSSVIGILAQRLVRRICERCKERFIPSQEVIGLIGIEQREFFRGRGCNVCKVTGYRGRIGIFELLVMNDEIRHLITRRASSSEIKNKAIEMGMKTLRQDGIEKALNGITTLEEVLKETQEV